MIKQKKHTSLLLTLEYPPQLGGISTYLSYLAEGFPVGGIHVLAPQFGGAHEADMLAKVPIYRRQLVARWFRPRWLPALYWTWWLCRKERPAVLVVSHLLNMGKVALFMRRVFRLPFVVILHGMDIALAVSGGLNKRLAAKEILSSASHIVCNSQYTAQWVKALNIPDKKISVVNPPPSVPLDATVEQWRADELRQRLNLGSSFVVLSTGRLVERKGFDRCLQAVAALHKNGRDIRYVIVGEGPERDKLEQLSIELGISSRVHFLGAATSDELAVAYSACDAFVMVPRSLGGDIEGFGIVYLEANVFGKPVIGSRSGGVPEAVLHEETGLLVDPNSVSELRVAIMRLMDDEQLRQKLCAGARRRLQRDYGDERQARLFVAVVSKVAHQV